MIPEPNHKLDKYRIEHPTLGDSPAGATWGCFKIKRPTHKLYVISSGTSSMLYGWEHVSVSRRNKTPTWEDMCLVKDLFWGPEETVLQFHPPRSRYYNFHPYVLHLWKQVGVEYELPPMDFL